jgi:aminoglycoside 2''-phosphotransferase
MPDPSATIQLYVSRVQGAYPDLTISAARMIAGEGQFNDIVVVNERLIFRFPRTPFAQATLAREVAVLTWIQGRLPLPIPNPVYRISDPTTGLLSGMGYPMLPGAPLGDVALAAITDPAARDRMAEQLATFLHGLHTLPVAELPPELPPPDDVAAWTTMHQQFREQLYSFMRPDARQSIDALFATLLDDLRRHPPAPALCHGDFGGSNILYNPQTLDISGVIDFSFTGLGDPAGDIASYTCFGEDIVARSRESYPTMQHMLPRARLYRGTFALQQALYALQDGNQADFDDGIQDYI